MTNSLTLAFYTFVSNNILSCLFIYLCYEMIKEENVKRVSQQKLRKATVGYICQQTDDPIGSYVMQYIQDLPALLCK